MSIFSCRSRNTSVLFAISAVVAAFFLLSFSVNTVQAAVIVTPPTLCPNVDSSGAIECANGAGAEPVWCGGQCQAMPTVDAPYGRVDCDVCTAICPSANPYECPSAPEKCQDRNGTDCAAANRSYTCNTGGGISQTCGGCVSGYLDCSGTCRSTTPQGCEPGQVWDTCSQMCTDPYIKAYATGTGPSATPQSADANIGGDLNIASGKAIRVDTATGDSTLNIGNWGGTGSVLLNVVGNIDADDFCWNNGASCISTGDGGLWDVVTGGINFADGNVGINTTAPVAKLTISEAPVNIFGHTPTNAGLLFETTYSGDLFTPGVYWRTTDTNPNEFTGGIWMQMGPDTGTAKGYDMIFDATTDPLSGITDNGRMRLTRGGNLHVSGNILAGTSIYDSTSARLKVSGDAEITQDLSVSGDLTANEAAIGTTIGGIRSSARAEVKNHGNATGSVDGLWVDAKNSYSGTSSSWVYGIYGKGDNADATAGGTAWGVGVSGSGVARKASGGWAMGVYATGYGGGRAHGIHASGSGGTTNYGGLFSASSSSGSPTTNYGIWANGGGGTSNSYGVYGMSQNPRVNSNISGVHGFVYGPSDNASTTGSTYGLFGKNSVTYTGASTGPKKYAGYLSAEGRWENDGAYGLYVNNETYTSGAKNGINKYGMYVKSTGSWTGGTGTANNNYGLYIGDVSGADTNYALYSNSTAASVFKGNVQVDGSITLGGVSKSSWPTGPWTESGGNVYRSSGNVGIGTTTPTRKLDVNGDVSIIGRLNVGLNSSATGSYATAIGRNATAGTFGSTAIGYSSTAGTNSYATALGYAATATGAFSTAINRSTASGYYGSSIGLFATASGAYSTAIGHLATASGGDSYALGSEVTASGSNAVAIGRYVDATNTYSIVIGRGASNTSRLVNNDDYSIYLGSNSNIPTMIIGSSAGTGTVGQTTIAGSLSVGGDLVSENNTWGSAFGWVSCPTSGGCACPNGYFVTNIWSRGSYIYCRKL